MRAARRPRSPLRPFLAVALAGFAAMNCSSSQGTIDNAARCDCNPGSGSDGTTTSAGCKLSETECDGACVDTSSDPAHCGGCNRACEAPSGGQATCEDVQLPGVGWESVCGVACDVGYASCGDAGGAVSCVSLSTPDDCGACGRACDTTCAGSYCEASTVLDAAGLGALLGTGSAVAMLDLAVDETGRLHVLTDVGLVALDERGGAEHYAPGFLPTATTKIAASAAWTIASVEGDSMYSIRRSDGLVTPLDAPPGPFAFDGELVWVVDADGLLRYPAEGGAGTRVWQADADVDPVVLALSDGTILVAGDVEGGVGIVLAKVNVEDGTATSSRRPSEPQGVMSAAASGDRFVVAISIESGTFAGTAVYDYASQPLLIADFPEPSTLVAADSLGGYVLTERADESVVRRSQPDESVVTVGEDVAFDAFVVAGDVAYWLAQGELRKTSK